jgi:transaldolase
MDIGGLTERSARRRSGLDTRIIASSIRSVNHVRLAALAGAEVVTVPPDTLRALVGHPLTDRGLETFKADWAKTGQRIV